MCSYWVAITALANVASLEKELQQLRSAGVSVRQGSVHVAGRFTLFARQRYVLRTNLMVNPRDVFCSTEADLSNRLVAINVLTYLRCVDVSFNSQNRTRLFFCSGVVPNQAVLCTWLNVGNALALFILAIVSAATGSPDVPVFMNIFVMYAFAGRLPTAHTLDLHLYLTRTVNA